MGVRSVTTFSRFLLEYPGFSQIKENSNVFDGNLKVEGNYFYLKFWLPYFPKIKEISGCITDGLTVYSFPLNIDSNLEISEFITVIRNYLANIVKSKHFSDTNSNLNVAVTDNIGLSAEQLRKLQSYKCRTFVNKKGNLIKFSDFEGYCGHQLRLKITSKNSFQIVGHTLPDCLFDDVNRNNNNELFYRLNTIQKILGQFCQFLYQLDEFYLNMDTIDELCYVVEPAEMTSKHNWRVFKLNEKIFIKITVDPLIPSSVEVNLIGPTLEIEKYREMYSEKVLNWDIDLDIHKNLLRIFNLIYFPMRNKTREVESEDKYCNICYMYMLENHIPIISCDNPKCHLIFHACCLKEWFTMLMDEKKFLDVNLGKCPFCKEKLSTSFVQLLELQ